MSVTFPHLPMSSVLTCRLHHVERRENKLNNITIIQEVCAWLTSHQLSPLRKSNWCHQMCFADGGICHQFGKPSVYHPGPSPARAVLLCSLCSTEGGNGTPNLGNKFIRGRVIALPCGTHPLLLFGLSSFTQCPTFPLKGACPRDIHTCEW